MTRDVEIASPDDTLQTAAQLMADLDSGILPVGENDRLVGVATIATSRSAGLRKSRSIDGANPRRDDRDCATASTTRRSKTYPAS
jgi:CBS domain-containing protein